MGVCLLAYSISTTNLDAVLSDPALVWRVLDDEDEAGYLAQLAAENKPSLLQRILGKARPARAPATLKFTEAERTMLDVDKAWDGLRVCIKLRAPDAPNFFEGDGKIGDFEVGYGPALYVTSQTVANYAAAIDRLAEEAVLEAYRTANFKGVYLEALWKRQDEDARSYLQENYRNLRQFVQHCANHKQAAILQFT